MLPRALKAQLCWLEPMRGDEYRICVGFIGSAVATYTFTVHDKPNRDPDGDD
jgi:hypothetical protein